MLGRGERKDEKHWVRRFGEFIRSFDHIQLAALLVLLGFGLVFIHSTGEQIGTSLSSQFFPKQLQWIALGGVLWFALARIDYRELVVPSIFAYLGAIGLLLVVLFWGVTVYKAKRWIDVPLLGMRLQPSEFAKLAVILVLASVFSSRKFLVNHILGILLAIVIVALPFFLIIEQPDLGSALVLLPIAAVLLFAANIRWKLILWGTGIALLLGTAFAVNELVPIRPVLKKYQRDRLVTFWKPEHDNLKTGYNARQARLAVGSGGLFGKGLGQGTQNGLGFIPLAVSNNDFIFSVIAEETGFAGCLLLFGAYVALLYSLLRTAFASTDPFGRYLCVGIAVLFFTHCYINIGMSLGLAPVTGVPLPLVSYGGSAILMNMIALGIAQSAWRFRPKAY